MLRLSLTHDRPVDGVWGFTEQAVDLTSGERFNWQGYLATHSDTWLELIFGDPPCRFAGVIVIAGETERGQEDLQVRGTLLPCDCHAIYCHVIAM